LTATGKPDCVQAVHGLSNLRVIDLTTGIAGPYCTKMFADAGADVIKVEAPAGDPLRSWSATGSDLQGRDGALFRFLNTSKRSVVAAGGDPEIAALMTGADLVVESPGQGLLAGDDLLERHPSLVRLTISPFGRHGPYADRPWTEFTLQAESGSLGRRGLPAQPPVQAGGRITDWVGGTFAAVAALAAVQRAQHSGQGEDIDFSLHECLTIAGCTYADLMQRLSGQPLRVPHRTVEIPSIEPTANGWVGFNTNSKAQYQAFLHLIERPDLLDDAGLAAVASRKTRMDEWNELVRAYTRQHPTAEIVAKASKLRIPVAPVCDGASVVEHEHFQARGVFVPNPDGTFIQPRPPYLINGSSPAIRSKAPSLGEHSGRIEPRPARRAGEPGQGKLPLEGIRVLDCTAWWAGPTATQMLAVLGADVIHLESIQRIDGMRMIALIFGQREQWWEQSTVYLSANTNKRNLTLDLAHPTGLQLAKQIMAQCDVVVENFSPRVFEKFGLGWDAVHQLNPRTILVRMPAFGLDGPWRDNVGFAQTMEQISGMAWITGHVDDQPRIPQGPCDPLAGMNAAFATLVALAEREVTGEGSLVEGPMVEGALNAGAEQIVEYSAYGASMQRDGNHSPWAAPQGVYACRGVEHWLAVSVATDEQWDALVKVVADPAWAGDATLATFAGRRAAEDRLDAGLSAWAADRDLDDAVATLIASGVPAAPVVDSRLTSHHPQLLARNFYETVDHPVVGPQPLSTVPFRFASQERSGRPWLRRRAPLLGEHNREILEEILGLTDEELSSLEADGVIGTVPID
jgi:crotonobetainyl-CoA:carnitine CoA-transferase CaiB-like acyl-CoA transferase